MVMELNGPAIDPIDNRIREYILANLEVEKLTVKGLAKKFHVTPERVKRAARSVLPIYRGPKYFTDKMGFRWANAGSLRTRYSLSNEAWQTLKYKYGLDAIRFQEWRTPENPFRKERFYCLDDIDRLAPRLAKRGKLFDQRMDLLKDNPSVAHKPLDLSELEYEVLLGIINLRLTGRRLFSIQELTQFLELAEGHRELVRKRIASLTKKGYIASRRYPGRLVAKNGRPIGGVCVPNEYRFLRGPHNLLVRLRQLDPESTRRFKKEDDV